MGTHAACTLLADLHGERRAAFAPVPWFWSDQYDRKVQLAGRSGSDDLVEVVSGDVADRRFVAFYGRAGRLVGVLGMNQPAKVMRWRALVEAGTPWEAALQAARDSA
jgi:NADPH-dependent 2,4-dienoyl-CoA reductase/sulfur reductase-like enzyme